MNSQSLTFVLLMRSPVYAAVGEFGLVFPFVNHYCLRTSVLYITYLLNFHVKHFSAHVKFV